MSEYRLLINGKLSEGACVDVYNPATEEIIAKVPPASEAQLDAAIQAAARAFPNWAATALEVRAGKLLEFAAATSKPTNAKTIS